MVFQKATKEKAKLRMALTGPSGSGKTYSALNIAQHLGKKVCVVDTEGNSASKYANLFDFCTLSLADCHPNNFIKAIDAAVAEGFDVIILDSFSHAYNGKNGLMDLVGREKMKTSSANDFQAWGKISPIQNALTQKILTAPIHILATLRVKTDYDVQKNEQGKMKPVKVGTKPIQKEGIEYEFDVLGDMDLDNNLLISKTRCPELNNQIFNKPGKEVADVLNAWLNDGAEPAKPAPVQAAEKSAEQPQAAPKETPAAAAPAKVASSPEPAPKKSPLKLQTASPKQAVPAQAEGPESGEPFPATGVFERTGVLAHIENQGANGANRWELFLKDVKTGLVTFSQAMNVQAVSLLGKAVKIKAVVHNPGQYVLLSISPAN